MPKTIHHSLLTVHYNAARLYHSTASVWLSVDPLSDKYPNVSPYVYCANNPVRLVDPDGREWEIEGICYIPGSSYDGDNETVRAEWNSMNEIYATTEGKKVIDAMNEQGVLYSITSDYCPSATSVGGAYQSKGDGTGGTIYLNGNAKSVGPLAHEMFHGYQDFKGQGQSSIHNEVQARIFSTIMSIMTVGGMNQLRAAEGTIFEVYNYNVDKILGGEYTSMNLQYVEENFKRYFDGYSSLPIIREGQTDLWRDLKCSKK